nr:MAG TPA: hypothetical protein [Caudoviricetes sp.]
MFCVRSVDYYVTFSILYKRTEVKLGRVNSCIRLGGSAFS